MLARLVKQGLLASDGRSRGMVYFLPGVALPTPEQVFVGPAFTPLPPGSDGGHAESPGGSSEHLAPSSEHSALPEGERDSQGRLISPHLDAPIIDDLALLDQGFRATLEQLAGESREKGRLVTGRMEQVILALCRDHFIALSALALLLDRNADALRQRYLSKMVRNGQVVLAFPAKPTHEKQAYRAVGPGSS